MKTHDRFEILVKEKAFTRTRDEYSNGQASAKVFEQVRRGREAGHGPRQYVIAQFPPTLSKTNSYR